MTMPRVAQQASSLLLSPDNPDSVSTAASLLLHGAVVAIPTDTVYGLAASVECPSAVRRLYEMKSRSTSKAIPILLSESNKIDRVAKGTSPVMGQLTARFWPGALTLVVEAREGLPAHVTSPAEEGRRTVAVRVPNHDLARQIINAVGGTLAVTSANKSGETEATDAQQVRELAIADLAAIVDGGSVAGGVPSTILSLAGSEIAVLREGAIPANEIFAFLASLDLVPGTSRGRAV